MLRMKRILIIGIGAGNPDYVTMQAVSALNEVDVFFILDKGAGKAGLTEFRRQICTRMQHPRTFDAGMLSLSEARHVSDAFDAAQHE
ncbi:MAG TPA: SAM-dependent methyltransferase [Stellaceae bacterium]